MARADLKDAPTPKKLPVAPGGKARRSEDPMVLAAEALIVKGKEHTLPLLLIKRREESIRGTDDSRRCRLRGSRAYEHAYQGRH